MNVAFGTKAETLERLKTRLQSATILPQVRFTVVEWREDGPACLKKISDRFGTADIPLIVRSASLSEDSLKASRAGSFASVLNISSKNVKALEEAILKVIHSYGSDSSGENQVFIQPAIQDVAVSGVVFTRDIDSLAPYYILNYDDQSKRTDTVTSGQSNQLKTLVTFREFKTQRKEFSQLFKAVRELETLLASDSLDIEFAIDSKGAVYILQARPLAILHGWALSAVEIGSYLEKIEKKIEKINSPHPYLYGRKTLLGVMPDWNPAEMLGIKPRPLALSLYKELITDRTWAYQRDNYGYKNLRSYPLMITLIGHPYIDVRVSFNSFIPKDVDEDLSDRLCNYYLTCLERNPASHDKVEFDIIFSCYFLDIDEKLSRLKSSGFSDADLNRLKSALLKLTNNVIRPGEGVFAADLKKIAELETRQKKMIHSELTDLEKIYWLIQDCARYGTLPFAGLARAAFIAVQLMRSLVDAKVITKEELERYLSSLNTVAKQLQNDTGILPREKFLERYGHLRPGTYDILSRSYDEAYELYFQNTASPVAENVDFTFSAETLRKLNQALKEKGLAVNASEFLEFVRNAIEGREYSKFVFTKSVSHVLKLIQVLAARYQLSVDDASFIDLATLLRLYATLDHRDLRKILTEEIERNRHFYQFTKMIRLPALIVNPEDVYEFELEEGAPNFITLDRCQAATVTEEALLREDLQGKIVLILSADPGYDWIFTKNIAGLITMYGGANSHMAIRSAELKIPAVIGAGEKNYRHWAKAKILELDSGNKQVRIIQS